MMRAEPSEREFDSLRYWGKEAIRLAEENDKLRTELTILKLKNSHKEA